MQCRPFGQHGANEKNHFLPSQWWNEGKQKIKFLAESFSKRNKEITVEIHKKEKQLRNAQTKGDRTGDARHARLASDLCNNIKRLEEKQAEGTKIRLKDDFLEQNEVYQIFLQPRKETWTG